MKKFVSKLYSLNLLKNVFDEFVEFIEHRIDMEIKNNMELTTKNYQNIKKIILSVNSDKFNNVGIFKYISS